MTFSEESVLLAGNLCVARKEGVDCDTILTFFNDDGSRRDSLVLIDAALCLAEQLVEAGYRVSKDEAMDFLAARIAYHKGEVAN